MPGVICPESLRFFEMDGFPQIHKNRNMMDHFLWSENSFYLDGKVQLFVIGDSMCRNVGAYEYSFCKPHGITEVVRKIPEIFDVAPYCINSTLPGAKIDRVIGALPLPDEFVKPICAPIFVLFVGTNNSHDFRFSYERFLSDYTDILNRVVSFDSRSTVICLNLLPRLNVTRHNSPGLEHINSNILTINSIISRVVSEECRVNVVLLDIFTCFLNHLRFSLNFLLSCDARCMRQYRNIWEEYYRSDGLHASGKGNTLLLSEVSRLIHSIKSAD